MNTTTALATIQAILKTLTVPPNVLTSTTSAASFQQVIAPLESNSDPNNPGLLQVFDAANADIVTGNALLKTDPVNPADIIALSQSLHDAYAAYEASQYLTRLSANIGFPGPAQTFFATTIPQPQQFGAINQIVVPGQAPPVSPPIAGSPPTSRSPVVPPSVSPIPTLPGPPAVPTVWLSALLSGVAGSGEPNNGSTLIGTLDLNSVYIPVYATTISGTSTNCSWANADNDPTVVGGMVDLWINAYNSAGLAVILSLVVYCEDGTSLPNFRPSDTITFLSNLQILAGQLAATANRLGADAISIAPELFPYSGNGDTPAQYMPQWTNIVSTVRNVFTGDVLYQATPTNAGPVNGNATMDWTIWDAVGVIVNPPFSTNVTSTTIQAYWETVVDAEGSAGYNSPIWGTNSWLVQLYNQWKSIGKKIWLLAGVTQTTPPTSPAPPTPTPTPAPPPTTATYRLLVNQPYSAASVWNAGVGSNATWGLSSDADVAQLRTLTGGVNAANLGQPIYFGQSTDPLCNVTTTDTFYPLAVQSIHIPIIATPAAGGNGTMTFMDATQPSLRWSFKGCVFNNGTDPTGGITATYGAVFNACGDGITDTQGRLNDYDFGIGSITDYDIAQGVITHALSYTLSPTAVQQPSSWLDAIWPAPHADFNITAYSGDIQFGVTIAIPSTVNVSTLGLTQGGLMLARALQQYGAFMRGTGGTNAISFCAAPDQDTNTAIVQMRSDLTKIVPLLTIMRNQGSTNQMGGGTSIAAVVLPAEPSVCGV